MHLSDLHSSNSPTKRHSSNSKPDRAPSVERTLLLAAPMAAVLLLAAFGPVASAEHVDPIPVPADKRVKDCTHFAPSEDAWRELVVNPGRDGVFADDGIEVTITGYDGKTFDFSANRSAVKAVYVRGGANDASNLYEYEPAEDADTNLTTPGEFNEIQFVSFCYAQQPGGQEEPCPTVTATANEGPTNSLSWTPVAGADEYKIYRAVGDGSFQVLVTVDGDVQAHEDGDVEQGETYRYKVTAVLDGDETRACNVAEVTAIPVFPTAIAAASAAVLGLGAYAVVRRRS